MKKFYETNIRNFTISHNRFNSETRGTMKMTVICRLVKTLCLINVLEQISHRNMLMIVKFYKTNIVNFMISRNRFNSDTRITMKMTAICRLVKTLCLLNLHWHESHRNMLIMEKFYKTNIVNFTISRKRFNSDTRVTMQMTAICRLVKTSCSG